MTALVVALTVVTVVNSIAVVALARQVGVLHLRLRPLPAHGVQLGPAIGSRLALPIDTSGSRLTLLCFVSSRCGTCAALLPSLRAAAATLDADEALTVVVDAADRVDLPAGLVPVAVPDALRLVPATPFVVVVDADGTVVTSGAVGSLEQVEFLLDQGRELLAARPRLLPLAPKGHRHA